MKRVIWFRIILKFCDLGFTFFTLCIYNVMYHISIIVFSNILNNEFNVIIHRWYKSLEAIKLKSAEYYVHTRYIELYMKIHLGVP